MEFFRQLGFQFDPRFTDDQAACMPGFIGAHIVRCPRCAIPFEAGWASRAANNSLTLYQANMSATRSAHRLDKRPDDTPSLTASEKTKVFGHTSIECLKSLKKPVLPARTERGFWTGGVGASCRIVRPSLHARSADPEQTRDRQGTGDQSDLRDPAPTGKEAILASTRQLVHTRRSTPNSVQSCTPNKMQSDTHPSAPRIYIPPRTPPPPHTWRTW
jgi:hypothetical protein